MRSLAWFALALAVALPAHADTRTYGLNGVGLGGTEADV